MRIWIDIENPPQVPVPDASCRSVRRPGGGGRRDRARLRLDVRAPRGARACLPPPRIELREGEVAEGQAACSAARPRSAGFLARRRPTPRCTQAVRRRLPACSLRVPSFSFRDYEYVNLTIDRLTRSFVVFPDAIAPTSFTDQGMRADRLLPFAGLKEDLSFAGIDPAGSRRTTSAPGR